MRLKHRSTSGITLLGKLQFKHSGIPQTVQTRQTFFGIPHALILRVARQATVGMEKATTKEPTLPIIMNSFPLLLVLADVVPHQARSHLPCVSSASALPLGMFMVIGGSIRTLFLS